MSIFGKLFGKGKSDEGQDIERSVADNEAEQEEQSTEEAYEAGLKYRTRGDSDPQGKPRVFFTAHPDDFAAYFEWTAELLHEYQNCAVYYEEKGGKIPWEKLRTLLSDMQLIVIPVTSRLLTKPCRTTEEIIPFAFQEHIPVLPLMMEKKLENLFKPVFGSIQYLQPKRRDETEIPFEQKIEKYLSGIFAGEELAARVRDAFDAYIFLSYRKKDRVYAQKLMRMIHSNDRYRGVAIWYDEYLVPGENYNHAIQSALAKGQIFTLLVTPSLLEKGNYVMKHEYPDAQKAGKTVLPGTAIFFICFTPPAPPLRSGKRRSADRAEGRGRPSCRRSRRAPSPAPVTR